MQQWRPLINLMNGQAHWWVIVRSQLYLFVSTPFIHNQNRAENQGTLGAEDPKCNQDKLGKVRGKSIMAPQQIGLLNWLLVWAGFTKQGAANDVYAKINMAFVWLICCASGTPPSIADCWEWKDLFDVINSKLQCNPPSATMLWDKLIPEESTKVNLLMKEHIKT